MSVVFASEIRCKTKIANRSKVFYGNIKSNVVQYFCVYISMNFLQNGGGREVERPFSRCSNMTIPIPSKQTMRSLRLHKHYTTSPVNKNSWCIQRYLARGHMLIL